MLCEGMRVISEDKGTILAVLHREEWNDLEDGLQMQCAKNVKADYIVTQNLKDFQNSETEVLSEEQLCEIIRFGRN